MDVTKMLVTRRAAQRLDLSVKHVLRLLRLGKLRGIETELGWFVDPDSITAYMRTRPDIYPDLPNSGDSDDSVSGARVGHAVTVERAMTSTSQAQRRTA